jgi:Na+/H+ antiporter NhaD/arsenite permease-like protein
VPAVIHVPHDRNQTNKGIIAMAALLALFSTDLPREVGGLVIAALLLANRKFTSRTMISAVDWPLLLLFACLFGVTGAVTNTGLPWTLISTLEQAGLLPDSLAVMAPLTLVMSNTIGNVPSVILLLQLWPNPPQGALYGLSLLSTLSGNLLLVGSLSNLIVVEQAAVLGVRLSFADFARTGIPITIASMTIAVLWLMLTGFMTWLPHP